MTIRLFGKHILEANIIHWKKDYPPLECGNNCWIIEVSTGLTMWVKVWRLDFWRPRETNGWVRINTIDGGSFCTHEKHYTKEQHLKNVN